MVAVSVDNDMFLLDLSLGGVISWRPVKPFGLYLGAGPTLVIGTVSVKDDAPELEPPGESSGSTDAGGRECAAGVSLCGRAGIEFIIDNFTFGVTVRKNGSKLDMASPEEAPTATAETAPAGTVLVVPTGKRLVAKNNEAID